MKKLLFFLFLLGLFTVVSAKGIEYDVPVCVTVNGKYISFDKEPVLFGGTTYLPVRFFCEALSAEVLWEAESQKVTVLSGDDILEFKIDENIAYVNGNLEEIGGYARLIDGSTYLPLRFIVEAIGGTVNWDENYFTAEIIMENLSVSNEVIGDREYTNDEIYWLAKIISSESEDEPMKGKIAVGNVVLNRTKSKDYPDTIYSVIFDKENGVQFQPTANGSIYKDAVKDAYLAAKLCLEGYNVVGDCKYFLNPRIATNFWIPNNKNYYTTIRNHDFYY